MLVISSLFCSALARLRFFLLTSFSMTVRSCSIIFSSGTVEESRSAGLTVPARIRRMLLDRRVRSYTVRTGTSSIWMMLVRVVPDIITLAKAMGGGMPLGAFVSSREIMGTFRNDPPLAHVTTFGGHPVSCAAARATLGVLQAESLPERARWIAEQVCMRLRHDSIEEIRGRGAMLGMSLSDAAFTERVVSRCRDNGVLLGWTLHSNNLVRIAPPLNISEEVLHEALDIIVAALDEG